MVSKQERNRALGEGSNGVRTFRKTVAAAVLAVLVGTGMIAAAGPAVAHSGEESYVYLDIFDNSIEGRVEYPVSLLGEVLDLDIPQDEPGASSAVEKSLQSIQMYTSDHLSMGIGTDRWELDFDAFEILEIDNGTYAVFPFTVEEDFGGNVPRSFGVSFDGVIETLENRTALLIIGTDFGSGTFNNEADHLLVYTADNTDQIVDLDDPSLFRGFAAVVGLGVEHIQIGSDHILFVIALVLPAVLIFRAGSGWEPAPDFGSSLWRVVKIATSFTVAHTITLTLGGLGIIELSPSLVEPIIALSIALAALHNLRPVFFNREWLIAFGFGLFHGFGFAGLLADLGLDRTNRAISLLGFNLGIELGQVVIILLVFPSLFLLRRTVFYLRAMQAGSVVLIGIALGWFVDRVFALDVGVDRLVTPVLLWPRPLIVAGVLLLAAAVAFIVERSRGRLIDVGESEASFDGAADRVSTH